MLMKTTLIAFLGATLCLDRSCLQLMVSRPIVTAPVIGLALGDAKTGLIIGAFLELLWVDRPPLGNYIPPNDSLLAVFITASTIMAGERFGSIPQTFIAFSLLLFLPLSYMTQRIDIYLTSSNDRLSDEALEDAKRGDIKAIERKHLLAIGRTFVLSLSFIFLFTILGTVLLSFLYPLLPATALKALQFVYFSFPVLMVAVTLNSIKMRRDLAFFCAIFITTILFFEMFYGLRK